MSAPSFHPAIQEWFTGRFASPTEPQRLGWPAIQSGRHTLISAPTGSGKTLAAFLASLDQLFRESIDGTLTDQTRIVYVSPLKALSNDIRKNLEEPLSGIRALLGRDGGVTPEVRAEVRTGDTPAARRQAIARKPPHILVTTPESFYLLLTSNSGRRLLRTVRTLIVDEIHAVAADRRGAHLALSMERLAALVAGPLQRIGLSATQKPIEEVARFLVGCRVLEERGHPPCAIIDVGHSRTMDVAVEIPDSPLQAVMSNDVWAEVHERLAQLIEAHKTTLVFVNTRRLAERLTFHLSERLGAERVTSHHGSLSAKLRLDAENRLKSGELKALVATASLELGIDIGSVDLVCQIGCTRSIATFLQRIGRAEHTREGLPKGRLFPLSRDELVECAALIRSVRSGELDRLRIPEKPLDVLAQQIVAAAACEEWERPALLNLVRNAYPYRNLTEAEFDDVVRMLAAGFSTRRGRRGALIHYDAVHQRIRARRGARLTALTSGGAIPDNADYRVILEPAETFIGTVNEDFAVESMAGDIFQLGNASWKITRIISGTVRVQDAQGQPPSIPFWLGEAPARTAELSRAVSDLRSEIEGRLLPAGRTDNGGACAAESAESEAAQPGSADLQSAGPHDCILRGVAKFGRAGLDRRFADCKSAVQQTASLRYDSRTLENWLGEETGLSGRAALQITDYFRAIYPVLGVIPNQRRIVLERFFDESGGMQLVLHTPFGSRINRAWGLALRKRFCRTFNFELQAAATDDAIVLSLGTQHSFALDEVFRYLNSKTVRDLLIQALLDAPMFATRWRWNASRALAVPRQRGHRRNPPPLQRMDAENLLAAVFPDQLACLENIVGDREVPDHPLVNQTIRDCLEEAMDIDGLIAVLRGIENGTIQCVARELPEPSPLSHEILNAKPYAFLDNAPLEERRTQAVHVRRSLEPASDAAALGVLDEAAIARVTAEAWPRAENPDELHDALMLMVVMTDAELKTNRPVEAVSTTRKGGDDDSHSFRTPSWDAMMNALATDRRAGLLSRPNGEPAVWAAAERLDMVRALFPESTVANGFAPVPGTPAKQWERADALRELVRGRMEVSGPVAADELGALLGVPSDQIEAALLALEAEGFVLRGRFHPNARVTEWCDRRLLARIHRLTVNRLRAEIQPVSLNEFYRFLFAWQRAAETSRVAGVEGVEAVLRLLDGYEVPVAAWEPEVLALRVCDYDPHWLDRLCFAGRIGWGRLTPPQVQKARAFALGPLRSSPISLFLRENLENWLALSSAGPASDLAPDTLRVLEVLTEGGALFFGELVQRSRLLPSQVEQVLGELAALGWAMADSFEGLRALLTPANKRPNWSRDPVRPRRGGSGASVEFAGRWSVLRKPDSGAFASPANGDANPANQNSERPETASDHAREAFARVLLGRYGVVFRRLLERESLNVGWFELSRIYRRWEARGEIRGGHFVSGVSGEQFALAEAVGLLRSIRNSPQNCERLVVSGADPLNLVGILTPGPRIAAVTGTRILFRDGVPVAAVEAGQIRALDSSAPADSECAALLQTATLPVSLRPFY